MTVKEKYKGLTLSNARVGKINTDEIKDNMIPFLYENGFAFIFEIKTEPNFFEVKTESKSESKSVSKKKKKN